MDKKLCKDDELRQKRMKKKLMTKVKGIDENKLRLGAWVKRDPRTKGAEG